jgi:hypothetical protein
LALCSSPASAASTSGSNLVRDLAFRAGPIVGAALVCRDIARSRLQVIVDKFTVDKIIVDRFHTAIRETASQKAERAELAQPFDRNIHDGTEQSTSGKSDCITAERRLSEFERSSSDRAFVTLAAAIGPASATDDGDDPTRTLAAMKQLYEKDQVFGYIGNVGTANAAVGATSFANELKLPGPRFTNGVLVSQIVPAVAGHSGVVLDYKNALAKYFVGEPPD